MGNKTELEQVNIRKKNKSWWKMRFIYFFKESYMNSKSCERTLKDTNNTNQFKTLTFEKI